MSCLTLAACAMASLMMWELSKAALAAAGSTSFTCMSDDLIDATPFPYMTSLTSRNDHM